MSKIVGLVYVSRDFPSNWKKLYDFSECQHSHSSGLDSIAKLRRLVFSGSDKCRLLVHTY
jgi:hypothetical protein